MLIDMHDEWIAGDRRYRRVPLEKQLWGAEFGQCTVASPLSVEQFVGHSRIVPEATPMARASG